MENNLKIYSSVNPHSYIAECYHALQISLEYTSIDHQNKVIQFTSAIQGESKSETSSNMAVVSAKRGKKTLIVDLDLRRPRVHRLFNVLNENGITDYLSGNIKKEQLIKQVGENLYCVTAGTKVPSVSTVLESEKLKEAIKMLKNDFDYVFVDTPPISVAADALIISKIVDGVVYILASRKAKKEMIQDAVSALKGVEANILGVVLTQIKKRDSTNYRSFKYKYE